MHCKLRKKMPPVVDKTTAATATPAFNCAKGYENECTTDYDI